MTWQPIDTAPKDGSEVLVRGRGKVAVVNWLLGGWSLTHTGGWAEDADLSFDPTEWHPIPD